MNNLDLQINGYLHYCRHQKKLSEKSLKAYGIDLSQFHAFSGNEDEPLSKRCITAYMQHLHERYKPKTVKRKLACIRAFLNYLEFDEQIDANPMSKIRLDFREPSVLPKALSLTMIRKLLYVAHRFIQSPQSQYQYGIRVRNWAILELMFATGLRVSELCAIRPGQIDLKNGILKIQGKGAKERIVLIGNQETLSALRQYQHLFSTQMESVGYFFINRLGCKLSEQSVRDMIAAYAKAAKIPEHVTPHMIRHSFATLMLEEDVDIRYIQSILGHSSITTTQIYTHVSLAKQRSIMRKKHPRNRISV